MIHPAYGVFIAAQTDKKNIHRTSLIYGSFMS